MAILISGDPKAEAKRFYLDSQPLVIGRSPNCDIVIDDPSVSRRHAEVYEQHGQFYVRDLSSRNGTLVNGTEITKSSRLFDGSRIRVCEEEYIFYLDEDHIQLSRQALSDRSVIEPAQSSIMLFDDLREAGSAVSSIRSSLDVASHHRTGLLGADTKLSAILTVTRALRDAHDRQSIVTTVMDTLFELFADADRGFVAFRDAEGQIVSAVMKTRRQQFEEQVRISRTIANLVLDSRQAILSSDAATDSRFDMSQSLTDFRIRSMMCAPLIDADDRAVGVIQLDTLRSALAFQQSDLEVLVAVAAQASLALQRMELFERFEESQRLQRELALAHQVQQRFLPQAAPNIPEYEFYAHYRAMTQVGGDYYDYLRLPDQRLAIVVADVVGHGVAAALLMAKISAEARYATATHTDPVQIVEQMNRNLSDLNVDQFVTLVMGVLDWKRHEITIVNAGHALPLIRREGHGFEFLSSEHSGMPLGIHEQASYPSITLPLASGDCVVFYTDGVSEAMNAAGEMLGTERMVRELEQGQARTPEAIGKMMCQSIRLHCGQSLPQDDVCLVSMGRMPARAR
ncbi:MAG TPA: SpoIIE family protein phosphatase [Pirellulaceae bacterium]|nr:SpoIIE family protein phosphatase [Pirellulaceae bacterium]